MTSTYGYENHATRGKKTFNVSGGLQTGIHDSPFCAKEEKQRGRSLYMTDKTGGLTYDAAGIIRLRHNQTHLFQCGGQGAPRGRSTAE